MSLVVDGGADPVGIFSSAVIVENRRGWRRLTS